MGRGKKRSSQKLVEQTGRYVPFFSSQRQQQEPENKKLKTSPSAGQVELIAPLLNGRGGPGSVEQDSPPSLSTLTSTAQQLTPDSELCPPPSLSTLTSTAQQLTPDLELCPPPSSMSDNLCTMHYSGLPISTIQLLGKEESTKLSTHSQQQEECLANSNLEHQLPIQTSPRISLQPSSPFPSSTHCSPSFLHLSNLSPTSSHCSPFPNLSQSHCNASPVETITTEIGHHSCTPTTVLVTCPANAVHSEDTIGTEQTSLCEGESIGESGEERGREASTAVEGRELEGSMASLPSGQAAQPNFEASEGHTTETCLEQPCLMKDPPQPPSVLVTGAALPVTAISEGGLLLRGIIQELSKLNESILRSKRELDSVRQYYSRSSL